MAIGKELKVNSIQVSQKSAMTLTFWPRNVIQCHCTPLPTYTSCGKVYYMGENKWLGQGFWIYIYVFDLDLLLQKLGSRSLQPVTKTHSVDVSLIATKKEKICSWTSKWSRGDMMHDHCGPLALRDLNGALVQNRML